MKWYTFIFLGAVFVMVDCGNTFIGTNVQRPMIYHHHAEYSSKMFRKRIENLYYMMPHIPTNAGRTIQGILAYDLTYSGASVNVTQGGVGFNFVNLRMKSDRGSKLNYDVYIYA